MTIKDKLTEEFLQAIKEIENILLQMLFKQYSFVEKGLVYYIQYRRDNTIVEFLFGPPEFQIEMIIYTPKGKYAFRDLLQIPAIEEWVSNNRYIQKNSRNVKDEMFWFVDLLKFSLRFIE